MLTRQYHFSLEKEGFTVVALSPGWIRTDLGGEYADLTIEEGAKVSLERILEVGKESGGKVVNIKVAGMEELGEGRVNRYDGEDMVW